MWPSKSWEGVTGRRWTDRPVRSMPLDGSCKLYVTTSVDHSKKCINTHSTRYDVNGAGSGACAAGSVDVRVNA